HVVEGDPQFGLALADFIEQPGRFHSDDGLRCEALYQRYLFFGEGADLPAMDRKAANQGAILAQRDPQRRAGVRDVNQRAAPRAAMAVGIGVTEVDDVNDLLSANEAIESITWKRRKRLSQGLLERRQATGRDCVKMLAFISVHIAERGFAEPQRLVEHRVG